MADLDAVRRLERVLLATWPAAEVEARDGWVLSANGGVTGRANSLTVLEAQRCPTSAALGWMEDWYRARGLVPMVRATPIGGDDLDAALTRRGYGPWPAAADVMRRDIAAAPPEPARADVELTAAPGDAWLALTGRAPRELPAIGRLLARIEGPTAFAAIHRRGELAAVGHGAVAQGHLAVYAMATAERHRRQGLARAVLGALERWALGEGAGLATLQVVTENEAAQRLYRRAGYEPVYRYRYLRAGGN